MRCPGDRRRRQTGGLRWVAGGWHDGGLMPLSAEPIGFLAMLLLAVHVFAQWRRGTASLRKMMPAEDQDNPAPGDREGAAADSFPRPPWWRACFGLWPGSGYVVFESAKSPEQLKADLRAALGPSWDIFTPGFKGWLLGPCVRVGWVPKWSSYWQRSHLAFRGWLVKGADGSGGCSLRGYIRMHTLLEFYLVYLYLLLMSFLAMHGSHEHDALKAVVSAGAAVLITWLTRLGAKSAVREIHARLTALCQERKPMPGEDDGHVG